MTDPLQPRRVLASCADKTGLAVFARRLTDAGVGEFLSTGGTARVLEEAGLPLRRVDDYTGSPEVLGGRVKTLHPRVHGGLLSRRTPEDDADLERLGAAGIDLLVVNLYPFRRTRDSGAAHAEVIEQIDIGGVALLRAAAKNYRHVVTVCDPDDYDRVAEELSCGGIGLELRRELAAKAFAHTAGYDAAIASFLADTPSDATHGAPDSAKLPQICIPAFRKLRELRYGENPHQAAALYLDLEDPDGLAAAEPLAGKELSFNNYWDLAAAWAAVCDFDEPAAVVVKHTNPCGLAIADNLARAYELALAGDPQSAFGSIIAVNRELDPETAELIHKTRFVECLAAPSYAEGVLERLRKKKNRRLLALGEPRPEGGLQGRLIPGGLLLQEADAAFSAEEKTVTRRQPSEAELAALHFAWRAVKHVKSNAVALASVEDDGARRLVGVGAGQMSRVDSSLIAVRKAAERAEGAVAASDAFFPMPDGLETLARAGVTAVIQPGGSKGDPVVIEAADEAGLAMIFTGRRHFKH
ncbi:MAG: bifunctional phosphoribosylaminoimidazolecarboxamide formyltransferase/IMP cyclohydrolase [Candidatus Coatesbacteria bacterium]|nr:bifunctional phosphoribosylaminoimidazolecarboxamide formyltransferase/IMP cyclohydrolase [Candidatus Coatesbacteria bacterium]